MPLKPEEWVQVMALIAAKAKAEGLTMREWRLCNLYFIEDEDGNRVKFTPTPIQWDFIRNLWWKNIELKARQVKISTVCHLLTLDRSLFTDTQTCGIIDKTDEDAMRKLGRIKFSYDHMGDLDDPITATLGLAIKQRFVIRKSNEHEMEFSNGSKIWASTDMRGGTLNMLWCTEVGAVSTDFPLKAAKIRAGALNAIHEGNIVIMESTFAGGRSGMFYDMIRLAQQSPPRPPQLTPLHWRFGFHGWADEPSYAIASHVKLFPTVKQAEYFAGLEKARGKLLTEEQKNWYILKAQEQRGSMVTEFPGTAEEAMQLIPSGAIYGDLITVLRAEGRICPLTVDRVSPLWTFWDIGKRDATAVWLIQIVGFDIHAVDFYSANGKNPNEHAAQMIEWERHYDRPIHGHYLPHDAEQDKAGTTWRQQLIEAGLRNCVLVPRTPKVWIGIAYLRDLLPRFRFNSLTCEKEFPQGHVTWPSGIAAIEAYKKKIVAENGVATDIPVHDECESGASSLRTFAESHQRGMLVGPSPMERESRRAVAGPQRAITGLRHADPRESGLRERATMR